MWDMFPFSSAVLAISLGMLFLGTAVPLLIFYWIEHQQWRMVQRRGHHGREKAVCLRIGGEESHLRHLLSRFLGGSANTTTYLRGPLSSGSLPCSASAGPPSSGPPRSKGQGQGQGRSNGCVFYPTRDFYTFQPLPAPVPTVQRLSLTWPEEEDNDSHSESSGSIDMGKPPGCVLGLCHLAQTLARGLRSKAPSLDTLFTVISEDVAFEEVTEIPGDTLLGSPRIPPPLSGPDAPTSSFQQRAPLKKRGKRAFRQLCCLC